MRKFYLRVTVFLLPLFIWAVGSAVLPPLDAFTFRAWEAVRPYNENYFVGPFYPNLNIEVTEQGDLGRRTPYAVDKTNTYITDKYGYRNNPASSDFDILILGDSMAFGSGLNQQDILASQIEAYTGKSVFNAAPTDFSNVFTAPFMQDNDPEVVIVELAEHQIRRHSGFYTSPNIEDGALAIHQRLMLSSPLYARSAVYLDVASRQPTFMRNSLFGMGNPYELIPSDEPDLPMLFWEDSLTSQHTPESIEAVVKLLVDYQEIADQREITLIFVAVPDKESIYYEYIPDSHSQQTITDRQAFLTELYVELDQHNINYIDVLTIYQEAAKQGEVVYQLDDTHWNEHGVSLVAQEVSAMLLADD